MWSRKTGKTTDQKRANASTASRPKKRPQSSPERIQKTRGAQNGTPKKPQNEKDARPKQANKTKRRGQKKKKKNNNTCGGVCGVLLALSSISSKRKGERRETTKNVVNPNPKTERTRQKTKPDIKRIF